MKLRAWRTSQGLKLAVVAERIGSDVTSLSRYERGERIPNQEVMKKIVEVTDGAVTPNDFYGVETVPVPANEAETNDDSDAVASPAPAAKVA